MLFSTEELKKFSLNFLSLQIKNDVYDKNILEGLDLFFESKLLTIEFCNILFTNNALLSGGCILKFLHFFDDEECKDLDIYVHKDKEENFTNEIKNIFQCEEIERREKGEKSLFFKQNNINKVLKLKKGTKEIDLIFTDTLPITVIFSFDLTICQNWFDGKNLFMLYKNHVLEKSGFLNKNYISLFFEGNYLTLHRILKYIDRNFQIKIPEMLIEI